MNELNPNHKVTAAVRNEWHKIAGLLMWKLGVASVDLTLLDLEAALEDEINIVLHEKSDRLTVRLVNHAEAERLARQEGGLPV